MPKKEHQPGFFYTKSEIINQEIALSKKSGWLYCEDGTKYSPEEVQILKVRGEITLGIHNVKKVFKGEIVKYEPRSNDSGEQNKREQQAGKVDDRNTSEKIPDINGNGQEMGNRELEIY
jgi:hypothetical protein